MSAAANLQVFFSDPITFLQGPWRDSMVCAIAYFGRFWADWGKIPGGYQRGYKVRNLSAFTLRALGQAPKSVETLYRAPIGTLHFSQAGSGSLKLKTSLPLHIDFFRRRSGTNDQAHARLIKRINQEDKPLRLVEIFAP